MAKYRYPTKSPAGTAKIHGRPDGDAAVRLAEQHFRAGRIDQVREICREILEFSPAPHVKALTLLGLASARLGAHQEAETCLSQAIFAQPGNASLYYNLGVIQRAQGKTREAINNYRKALQEDPALIAATINLGITLKECGALNEALDIYQSALQGHPEHALLHQHYAIVLREMGRYDESERAFKQALTLDPNDTETHNGLGILYQNQQRMDKAAECFSRTLQINPRHALAHYNMGNLRVAQGEAGAAADCYRRAIELEPRWAQAHHHLAACRRHEEYDDEIKDMENLLRQPGIDQTQMMHLHFALGKSFEDIENYHQAFTHFSQACQLKRSHISYDIEADAQRFATIAETFEKSLLDRPVDTGDADPLPVFIVGMPRSGTTLVEQILASHPQVSGAGELRDLHEVVSNACGSTYNWPKVAASMDEASLAALGREYTRRLRRHARGTRLVTDKMPPNFIYIGMIRLMLPDARIIHCTRNPLDTCLSCFTLHFANNRGGIPHKYSYDLSELGRYYRLYKRLMDHWHQVLPGSIYDVTYESLVADPETVVRSLLDHCGLPWDDACMAFHNTKRTIQTASASQVKKPIYRHSVGRWRRYEPYLTPLLQALELNPQT